MYNPSGQFARVVKGGLKIHCRQLRVGSNPTADICPGHVVALRIVRSEQERLPTNVIKGLIAQLVRAYG